MDYRADIGVFGGSGFYSFLDNVREVEIETPYGKPSDKISLAEVEGKIVAFIPRHSKEHSYPPHLIPYRANMYAMKMLGVKYIIAPTASGSLRYDIKPGDFVICNDFIDRTWGRKDTYFESPVTKHISSVGVYDKELRRLALEVCKGLEISVHDKGTVVVIQGPRFSSKAESKWYREMGCDVINMTQYPECYLAKELEIPYANIALITDYDAGLEDNDAVKPVTEDEVYKVFSQNNEKVKKVIFEMIKKINI